MADDDDLSPSILQRTVKPDPDPTRATQDAITDAKEQLRREAAAMLALINARLTGIESAATKFEENLNRIPTSVQTAVANLKELHEAKLQAVHDQFDQTDKRYALVSADAKAAVADALSAQQKSTSDAFDAQQKSVDKQDIATQKAIDALGVLLTNTANGQAIQINDLKERMTRSETANANAISAQSTKTTSVGQLISWGLLGIAALALILPFILSHTTSAAK